MIERIIAWSVTRRVLVLLIAAIIAAVGTYATLTTPVDAFPDVSDTQVIIRTTFPGQSPQVVQDQVTAPVSAAMMSVPYAKVVRGFSTLGESYVYVLFEDGTDVYWARSRVLEYLAQLQGRLPQSARVALGPDATGIGWVYEYALVDRSGDHDISELRRLQDWFLKFELKAVAGVAEVATLGGFSRQYQIVLRPDRLRTYGITLDEVLQAVRDANGETSGGTVEIAGADYVVKARGYLTSLDQFRAIPIGLRERGIPVLLGDVAWVQMGPESRRGVAELNGEGEVVGGIVVMRSGANARTTIAAVKAKLSDLQRGLPKGVEIVETYDRSSLIQRAITNLSGKLVLEMSVVALVCAAFLMHVRAALVAVVSLPLGVVLAFLLMRWQGITANVMSLGGIAIAIGAMVDAAVVMLENAMKHLEKSSHAEASPQTVAIVMQATREVGPALFLSLLIITLSFVPMFALQQQEGRLITPLAFTKTYCMGGAAIIAVTVVPALMALLLRGTFHSEQQNPISRLLIAVYEPIALAVLRRPRLSGWVGAAVLMSTLWPLTHMGSEFLPPLEEGTLLYMPTSLPGLSIGEASAIVQRVDKVLVRFPEVERVFGKMGRAETATDPAPIEMMETTLTLKPKSAWRPGMTMDSLIAEMDAAMQIPGMGNLWVQPIRNRIDMLATGVKSPVGVKVSGPSLAETQRLAAAVEAQLKRVRGTASAVAERLQSGRYIEIEPDREAAARYGLSVADIQRVVTYAIGGESIGESVQGLQRFPINVRYERDARDSLAKLQDVPIITAHGATITLAQIAKLSLAEGPSMIRSENARLSSWVYVDVRDRDLGSYVDEARTLVQRTVPLPAGYSIGWSGQYEALERTKERLAVIVPLTLAIIFLLLFIVFDGARDAALVLATIPFGLSGGFWLCYVLGHRFSLASAVGFIALFGLAAEFGVVMLIFLRAAVQQARDEGQLQSQEQVIAAVMRGAIQRVRPKAMTVAVIVLGMLPLFWGDAPGSEIMRRIAAPMLGGMLTAPTLSMLLIPAAYVLLERRRLR